MASKVRQIQKRVVIKDISLDKELYPRENYYWKQAKGYATAMEQGDQFPKIILGLNNGTLYLIDGRHRIEAHKILKIKEIDAVVYHGLSKAEIFKMAVKTNTTHGMSLSAYDRRRCAVKLIELGVKNAEVANLINVESDELQDFVGQRMVNTITGEAVEAEEDEGFFKSMGNRILKNTLKHYAGTSGAEAQRVIDLQKKLPTSMNQDKVWATAVYLLENDLADLDSKENLEKIGRLKTLLRKVKL